MSGMGQGLLATNPVVVAAFRAALRFQGLLVFLMIVTVLVTSALGVWQRAADTPDSGDRDVVRGEPSARKLLRTAFGILWILDGFLQAQPAMPIGMPAQVVQPAAATSPAWVQHLVADGLGIWTRHPITAAASVVWIQVGIGLVLLVAPRGAWSRAGAWLSVGWSLLVWVFGEAFGGIFAPGASWLFGTPGAVLFYALAGLLVALPDSAWVGQRLGRTVLTCSGVFFLAMSLLQGWPGRGFWQGQPTPQAEPGSLTAMVQDMSGTPQPRAFGSLVSWFARFDAAHGWGTNLFVVVALALIGAGLLVAGIRWQPGLARVAVLAAAFLCLADWILVQDLGFFGGLGTDPNSMLPMLLVLVAGYLACLHPQQDVLGVEAGVELSRSGQVLGAATALAALAVVLVGVVPIASASVDPRTDPIVTEALNGDPLPLNSAAVPFTLVDQHGHVVTLASLRGRVVALTFLDPVCTTDCPVIARQFIAADQMLGDAAARTVFVAIVANPVYRSASVVQAFDRQEHLDGVANWVFLTGSLADLQRTWDSYGYRVQTPQAGAMVAHDEVAYIIDASGEVRMRMGSDPGVDAQSAASLATQLADGIRTVMSP